MTRETKIGLLVGLAFIIVIGILLSDHLTSSTEPPQATLAVAGNNVRSGVTTPGANSSGPITSNVTPAPVSPRSTVPTQSDLAPKPQPVQPVQVAVGGPTNVPTPAQPTNSAEIVTAPAPAPAGPVVEVQTPQAPTAPVIVTQSDPVTSKGPPVTVTETAPPVTNNSSNGNTDIATALREAARQHGEELVTLGGANTNNSTLASSRQAPAGTKPYVAVEGDSLNKLAGRFLGANNKANRDAIVAANPSLKADPNKIIVGKTYNIPTGAVSGVATSVATSSSTPAPAPTIIQAPTTPAAPAATSDTWYTVKEGDSLWRIATEQCGTSAAVQAIKDLNKETLKGDTVVVNTKIRLPNKVASAN